MSNKFKAGAYVTFRSKVYKEPYFPYYNAYKEHIFRVVKVHEGEHYQLICVSDATVKVNGHVHADELKRAKLK